MATKMKGLLKGLRYITQIFDEEKDHEMQIGFPTDVKHVAHIGSDSPATDMLSWTSDFKPQEHDNGQGAGLKELLPSSNNEKPKQKTRRKPGGAASPNTNGSPVIRSSGNAASTDEQPKQPRHNRSTHHGAIDSSSDQEPSVRRRRGGGILVQDKEATNHLPDGSTPPRKATSRPRKLKISVGGEASMKKPSKEQPEDSIVNNII